MAKQGERLAKRLAGGVVFIVALIALVATLGIAVSVDDGDDFLRDRIVELNDVREDLSDDLNGLPEEHQETIMEADQALEGAQDILRDAAGSRNGVSSEVVVLIAVIAIAAVVLMALYLYRAVVRPFTKLERFAEEVASGNLDAPLAYERSNPFGKFTWSFDHLRKELDRTRKDEERAREDHKTALASLSHDLRTPLASLRAYAEALEMGIVDTEEQRAEYERAIMRKCDEASSLMEDLFQHALSDMDRISVECSPVQARPIVERCASDVSGLVRISCDHVDDALVHADEARLAQVIDNLVGNSIKYARGSEVQIEAAIKGNVYEISVRDFGPGIPAEDLPFATERFYRGSNVSEQPGSGLGLFISAYLMERMGGRLRLENAHPGLKATVELPIADTR